MSSASASYGRLAGWLADKIQIDFKIFKIFYKLKHLDFYFVNITTMLFISVTSAFQLVLRYVL